MGPFSYSSQFPHCGEDPRGVSFGRVCCVGGGERGAARVGVGGDGACQWRVLAQSSG